MTAWPSSLENHSSDDPTFKDRLQFNLANAKNDLGNPNDTQTPND